MVFGGGASGKKLVHEVEPSSMGLVPLDEEVRKLASSYSALWGHSKKIALCIPGKGHSLTIWPVWYLDLRPSTSGTVEKQMSVV